MAVYYTDAPVAYFYPWARELGLTGYQRRSTRGRVRRVDIDDWGVPEHDRVWRVQQQADRIRSGLHLWWSASEWAFELNELTIVVPAA